jgi:hypothetical protein
MLGLHIILGNGYTTDEQQTLLKHVVEKIGLTPTPEKEASEMGTSYTWQTGCSDIREELRNKIFYLLQDHPIIQAKSETWLVGYPD